MPLFDSSAQSLDALSDADGSKLKLIGNYPKFDAPNDDLRQRAFRGLNPMASFGSNKNIALNSMTDDMFHPADEKGNRMFNEKGNKHLDSFMPDNSSIINIAKNVPLAQTPQANGAGSSRPMSVGEAQQVASLFGKRVPTSSAAGSKAGGGNFGILGMLAASSDNQQ